MIKFSTQETFISRFTVILGDSRYSETIETPLQRKRPRLSSPEPSIPGGFGPQCQICNKEDKKVDGKKFKPYKILTRDAEAAIKNAAKSKDPAHYFDILNVDLVVKEYKVHAQCYKSFVKLSTAKASTNKRKTGESVDQEGKISGSSYDTSNFDDVKQFVYDVVLGDQRAISIGSLHELYGLGIGNLQ